METRANYILIGSFTLAVIAAAVGFVLWFQSLHTTKQRSPLRVVFEGPAAGLVAPALHDADQLTLAELMAKLRDLVNRTRAGSLRSSELSDPTITVTSLGDQGVERVFGVIYPPQVALVGFGRIADRAVAYDGRIEARPVVTVTLSADHRASDGHRGGLFLTAIEQRLQHPETL